MESGSYFAPEGQGARPASQSDRVPPSVSRRIESSRTGWPALILKVGRSVWSA